MTSSSQRDVIPNGRGRRFEPVLPSGGLILATAGILLLPRGSRFGTGLPFATWFLLSRWPRFVSVGELFFRSGRFADRTEKVVEKGIFQIAVDLFFRFQGGDGRERYVFFQPRSHGHVLLELCIRRPTVGKIQYIRQ